MHNKFDETRIYYLTIGFPRPPNADSFVVRKYAADRFQWRREYLKKDLESASNKSQPSDGNSFSILGRFEILAIGSIDERISPYLLNLSLMLIFVRFHTPC
jgi:hypothetical protein